MRKKTTASQAESKPVEKEQSSESRVKEFHKKASIAETHGFFRVYSGVGPGKGAILSIAKNPDDAWKKALHNLL